MVINEAIVLNYYLDKMKKDEIIFLQTRETYKKIIECCIQELLKYKDMHQRIQTAKRLWKELFEAAMTYIDPDKGGYDTLYNYFDEYVNFEELIFASDSFYRDHTLHCLWVYFLGEYLQRNDKFNKLFVHSDSEIVYSRVSILYENTINGKLKTILGKHEESLKGLLKLSKTRDSIRCITALTHDLGYPLKKIGKINKSIQKVLPYFSINLYDEFNFSYTNIQQSFINNFLDLLSMSISVYFLNAIDKEGERLFLKIFKITDDVNQAIVIDDEAVKTLTNEEKKYLQESLKTTIEIENNFTTRMRYAVDLEQYEHGIMSAYLLMKTINALSTFQFLYFNNKDIVTERVDFFKLSPYKEILQAITDHTSSKLKINNICDTSEFLIFIDELEEFSRISRADQNRQYVNEFCKISVDMVDEWFQVDFIFDNDIENINPEFAFKNKCKRFLSMFDINNLAEKIKLRLCFIGKIPSNNNKYVLEIKRKYANIIVNDVEQNIPIYLKSRIYYTKEEYMQN